MIRPVDVLLEFLTAEEARGVTHIHLDEGARDALRDLFYQTRGSPPAAPAQVAEPQQQQPTMQLTVEAEPVVPPLVPVELVIEGETRDAQLASLRRQTESWPPIRDLGTLRDTMVFAAGPANARLMLIGEAPGYQEERDLVPFAGATGQKLDDILKAMGISRDEIYVSHLVKFRPATARQTTNNRKPTAEEMAASMPVVRAEIGIVKPTCILALGETAAEGLLGLTGGIPGMRGAWHDFEGTPVRVTFAPSYLLQTTTTTPAKRLLWEDMLAVMEKLALPISDRQRGFFQTK